MKKLLKRIFKLIALVLVLVLVAVVGLFAYLTVTEYRPADVETLEIDAPEAPVFDKNSFTVLSLNTGYCALDASSDFFMDGGTDVRPDSADQILANREALEKLVLTSGADFTLLQEVDSGSHRSYNVDEVALFRQSLGRPSAYALNYSCDYVPFPWPPLGKVHSGLLTVSDYRVDEAQRVSLPCPFSWPVSTANLKRCLLVSRVPIDGTDKSLVLVNLHLEAYDDGEGKIAQTNQLLELLRQEYAQGNYVVAGGDWNQIFPGGLEAYPNEHPELWTPGLLQNEDLDPGWAYAYDLTTPTCRLLNQPYDPADTANTQYYVIDGFLVSPNLQVIDAHTVDAGFANTDHNPVLLTLRLGGAE